MAWRKPKEFQCAVCAKDFDKERKLKGHVKDCHGIDYAEYKRRYNESVKK